jgi:hypothetical protein
MKAVFAYSRYPQIAVVKSQLVFWNLIHRRGAENGATLRGKDSYQTVWIGKWNRSEQYCVQHAEHGCACADPQGKRNDRDRRKSRALAHLAQGIA